VIGKPSRTVLRGRGERKVVLLLGLRQRKLLVWYQASAGTRLFGGHDTERNRRAEPGLWLEHPRSRASTTGAKLTSMKASARGMSRESDKMCEECPAGRAMGRFGKNSRHAPLVLCPHLLERFK